MTATSYSKTVRFLLTFAFIALAAQALAACGASARETALHGSLAGVNAAGTGFVAWDATHQDDIVTHAASLADGEAKLAAYRADREKILAGFAAAYQAIATVATDEHASLLKMLADVKALYDAVAAIMGSTGATPAPPAPSPAASTGTAPATGGPDAAPSPTP